MFFAVSMAASSSGVQGCFAVFRARPRDSDKKSTCESPADITVFTAGSCFLLWVRDESSGLGVTITTVTTTVTRRYNSG